MPNTKNSPAVQDDAITHAPESGEPTETGRPTLGKQTDPNASTDKARPGDARQGQDFESGRPDAKP